MRRVKKKWRMDDIDIIDLERESSLRMKQVLLSNNISIVTPLFSYWDSIETHFIFNVKKSNFISNGLIDGHNLLNSFENVDNNNTSNSL